MPDEAPGRLTVHVLDTARGCPAVDLGLSLYRLDGDARELLATRHTNKDGRCDAPLLFGDALLPGRYEIVFGIASWRAARGEAEAGFYDLIPIRFRIADAAAHYHIPLLLSPFGYTTYRGT
ncbi:MAG TPA: hydroxyisourate hydrolase [Acetobacteraceae bacterium]|nr:hydroxyisourate hydrolase [Acetobacteraceae bacterium]